MQLCRPSRGWGLWRREWRSPCRLHPYVQYSCRDCRHGDWTWLVGERLVAFLDRHFPALMHWWRNP